ncbi:hypothetical protein F511_30706 [Dorcoceras hygrometricum]|uniref:Retrotransposon gag domain-containing protein n=1 Tax=Dorcoceras hygrometricum TaxID=472368 RepID=A0A2Z7DKF4_9LAMI|nr:hypothetical protein F511_30706 [Dorcoceras hygrometricum]
MDIVIERFQRMNPQVFTGDDSSEDADSWLQKITGLFDRVQYDDELRLSLVTLQLRKDAERWWRGATSTLLETGVGITWDSFCETFRQEYVPESYVNAREQELIIWSRARCLSTQTTQKQEKKYEVKPQYEELSKQLIMQHAIINAMKCMRDIKGRIARPVNQLANHINRASIPRTVYQPGKSSVRDLQSPSAHHSSVVFRHNQSVCHHSDDSVGLFRHDTSVGQSQRGSKSGHQSICQSSSRCMNVCQFNIQCTMHTIQYVKTECKTQSIHKLYHVNHRNISADFTTSITAMFTLKAVKSAQFVPPTADFYLNRYNKARQFQPAPTSFHLAPSTTAEAILNIKFVKEAYTQFISSSNLNFNT